MRLLIQSKRFHLRDNVVLELLVAAFLRGRERGVLEPEFDVLVLQPAQPLVGIGHIIEGFDNLWLELSLDGSKRERVFQVIVVKLGLFGRARRANPVPRPPCAPGSR